MKLSELPVGAVVKFDDKDVCYEKREIGSWFALNGDVEDFIDADMIDRLQDKARIISMPWSIVAKLVTMLQDEYGDVDAEGEDITFDSVLTEVIKERQRDRDLAKKVKMS